MLVFSILSETIQWCGGYWKGQVLNWFITHSQWNHYLFQFTTYHSRKFLPFGHISDSNNNHPMNFPLSNDVEYIRVSVFYVKDQMKKHQRRTEIIKKKRSTTRTFYLLILWLWPLHWISLDFAGFLFLAYPTFLFLHFRHGVNWCAWCKIFPCTYSNRFFFSLSCWWLKKKNRVMSKLLTHARSMYRNRKTLKPSKI